MKSFVVTLERALGFLFQEIGLRSGTPSSKFSERIQLLYPEPLHEYFDLFVIGEAEELVVELLNLYRKYKDDYKAGRLTKENLLIQLSKIPGVYAPSLYQADYNMCRISASRPCPALVLSFRNGLPRFVSLTPV